MDWPFCQGSDVSALEKLKVPLARHRLMLGYPSMVVSPPNLKIWFPRTQVRPVLAVLFSSKSCVSNAPPTPFVFAKRVVAPQGDPLTHAHPPVAGNVGEVLAAATPPIPNMVGKRFSS